MEDYNIKNNYLFNLTVYKINKKNHINHLSLNSGDCLNLNLNNIKKLIFSYKEINFGINKNKIFKCSKTCENLDTVINRNMDSIIEMFDIDNKKIINKFINKIIINNLYQTDCIMCLELKPKSNNYFQCLNCKNHFICYDCFKLLQGDDRLNNKCLLCLQNYT